RTSSAVPEAGTPNSEARAAAASGNRSPTRCTCTSGKDVRWVRYSAEMVPAPMRPMPTGPVDCWGMEEPFEVVRGRSLHRAGGEPGDEVLLHHQETDDHRDRHRDRGG